MPRVFDLLKPLDSRDTYAITDVTFQKGGLREVETIQDMYSISQERRSKGMIAFIIETGDFYSLGEDLSNNSWKKIDFSESVTNNIAIKELTIKENNNSFFNTDGENLFLPITDTSILKIKNGISISSLLDEKPQDGKIVFLQNISNKDIFIKNNYFHNLNKYQNILTNKTNLKKIATDGEILIAVSSDGYLIKTNDEQNWENISNIDNNSWQSIVYFDNKFIAVANDGINRLIFSSDKGLTWNKVSIIENDWQDIACRDDLFVIISNNKVLYSSDLIEWSSVDIIANNWKAIAYGNEIFVAIGDIINDSNAIIYSNDNASTWQIATKPNSNSLKKIKFINNKFYAISDYDIITSIDGIEWTSLTMPFDLSGINDIIYYYNYHIFIKKNKVYYTHNFNYWQEFDFINEDYINHCINIDSSLYFVNNTKIDKLIIDIVVDNKYQILTGTNFDVTFLKNSSIVLQFSDFDNIWRIIGGLALNPVFLDLFDVPQDYPQVQANNNLFLSVNPNQTENEKVIFNNPFPVIEDENEDLIIDKINGLKIRKFDNEKGKIIFANRFIPTYSFSTEEVVNFDDHIDELTVHIENDTFVPNIKLSKLDSVTYYKNDDSLNLINISNPSPSLPYINNDFSWSQKINFTVIQDINPNFFTFPNTFTLNVIFKSTNDQTFSLNKKIEYNIPSFDFSVSEVTQEFRNYINVCDLIFIYSNIRSKENNSSIKSIVSNIPNTSFANFTDGMTTYQALNLNIASKDITKTNNLVDSAVYTFTAICRYTRPIEVDPDQNYYEITQTRNLNINFTYPVFINITDISITSLNLMDIMSSNSVGNDVFPRTFTSFNNTNVNWWFSVRKRYINNRVPTITLTSNGLSMETNIVHQNDLVVMTSSANEEYTCYAITLQANINYSINIFFS